MTWVDRRVFVTGATGIVGSWLVKRLLGQDAYVVVLIRDWDLQAELIRSGDVQRTSVVSGCLEEHGPVERAICEHEIDTVFHLGAQTIVGTALRAPVPTFEANIRGTWNLLEACRLHRDLVQRIVVASSDKAYGESEVLPYTEDMPVRGRHPYDVSKSCADLISLSYAHTYDLPVAVARCGNIYGGGDLNWSRIVPGTIRSVLSGRPPVLRSDGRFTRDYIFVGDVVDAYLALAARCPDADVRGQAFNFSAESPASVLEMTRAILEVMDRTDLHPTVLDRARAEIRHQHLDATKARRLLGWAPRHSLKEGLRETIHWYEEFLQCRPAVLSTR